MPNTSQNLEWLSLVEVSGPFLAATVLDNALPQGLEPVGTPKRQRLRAAYDEWQDAIDQDDPLLESLHAEWIRLILTDLLEYDPESLVPACDIADVPTVKSEDGISVFTPTWVIKSPASGKLKMLVAVVPPRIGLDSIGRESSWATTLRERMTALCRANGVRVGLLTNGEQWMVVNAPADSTSGQASWYARYWLQEPITLRAFQTLLNVRRCFGPDDATLDALLEESIKHQDEVTDTLGEQVRRAVEVLIQALDRADEDRGRELLRDVTPPDLYEAGLTVMMRLVFLLCAEERGLLLLSDPGYDEFYAISTLRGQLDGDADLHGPEVLERRYDAWSRLLALFRGIYGGIDHEDLRLPAMGGSLFDPDRFPFLEGRSSGTSWVDTASTPLPIDNRTVLLLLNSLQVLEQTRGALTLSYRALDVEQIGYIYEGLLEHTVTRVGGVTLGLRGTANNRYPSISLAELESARLDGEGRLADLVASVTGRNKASVVSDLTRPVPSELLASIGFDPGMRDRVEPFANLLRLDAWNAPIVYHQGAFMVTGGSERRETGTHYTPKVLTEQIVQATLEPAVYQGPSTGDPRDHWVLRTPDELLDLKVCDPAMGSGAFLVQACRYLAEKLTESWFREEAMGKEVTADGVVVERLQGAEPLPSTTDERLALARQLIAERCLYGIDVNPLAVELAKLSIWLVTLARGRPFGFLDHNLRPGDSLLGVHRTDQLTQLTMRPVLRDFQPSIFTNQVEAAVTHAISLRAQLVKTTIRDVTDVMQMACLNQEARIELRQFRLIADCLVGIELTNPGSARATGVEYAHLSAYVSEHLRGNDSAWRWMEERAHRGLAASGAQTETPRKPLHWALEFPEVFCRDEPGFDAVLGNPPFVDSETMSVADPDMRAYLVSCFSSARGNWDLYVPFIERGISLTRSGGLTSLMSPNKWLAAPYGTALRKQTSESLTQVLDYSHSRAFPRVGVAAICTTFGRPDGAPALVRGAHSTATIRREMICSHQDWGFLLSDHIDLLMRIASSGRTFGEYVAASDPFTVAEAYELKPLLEEGDPTQDTFRFINTGTIDPFVSLWGLSDVRYLKSRYSRPVISRSALKETYPRRYLQASSPKLILSGMRRFEAFLDRSGEYVAGKSSVIAIPRQSTSVLVSLLGILNSQLMRFFVQEKYGALGIDGGISFSGPLVEQLPLPSGYVGKLTDVESSVERVLAATSEAEWMEGYRSLNQAVFAAYGLDESSISVISRTEIRC